MRLMRGLLALLALLAAGSCAAQTPFGFQTSNGATAIVQVADFSGTLTGYGGVATVGGALLTAQTPQLISAGTAGCHAGDFVVDGNLMLSPNNAAGGAGPRTWDGHTVSTSFGYGSLSATYAYTGACVFSVVNANGATILVTMTFIAGLHHVTALNGQNFNNDTATNFQLRNELDIANNDATGRNVLLGDTISIRDTVYPNSLNPTSASRFVIAPPAGLWSAGSGSRITITSDNPISTMDANGNPKFGGNAQIGELEIDAISATDIAIPLDFVSVSFYTDASAPFVAPFFSTGNKAHGFTFNKITAQTGPHTLNWTLINGIVVAYNGSDASPVSTTVQNSYFTHVGAGISVTSSAATAGHSPIALIALNNVFTNFSDDAMDFNGQGSDIEGNYIGAPNPCCAQHPDSAQLFPTSFGGGPYSYTVKNNVAVGLRPAVGSGIGSATILNAGSGYTDGTYGNTSTPTIVVLVGSATGTNSSPTIVVSGGAVTSLTYPTVTNFSTPGMGYKLTDVLTLSTFYASGQGGSNFTAQPATLVGSQDMQGAPFFNNTGTDTYSGCTIQGNIYIGTFGNGQVNYCSAANDNYNDTLSDFQADGGTSSPAGVGTNATMVFKSTTGGGNWDNNISNFQTFTSNSGANSCYPGTYVANAGCNTATQALARSTGAYNAAFTAYDTQANPPVNRAKAFANVIPKLGGTALNGNGSYSGTLTPKDLLGIPCLNNGLTNFDNTKTCVAQGLTPAI